MFIKNSISPGYIKMRKKNGDTFLMSEVNLGHPIATSNNDILYAAKGYPFTLDNIYKHEQFDGVNNARVSMRLFIKTDNQNILVGTRGFLLDIDLSEDNLLEERKALLPFLNKMRKFKLNIVETGGGYHLEGFFDKPMGIHSPLFDQIMDVIKKITNRYLFDPACDPYGSIRPPHSFDVARETSIIPIWESLEKRSPLEWLKILNQLLKFIEIETIPHIFTERLPVKITKSRKVCVTKGSKFIRIRCPKYVNQKLPIMERGIYKDAIPPEIVFNPEMLKRDLKAFQYASKRNKKLNEMSYQIFTKYYYDGNRNISMISFLAYLRQQGLTCVNSYIAILQGLELKGIRFTQNSLNSLNYFFKKALKGSFIKYKYKINKDFIDLGKFLYETKQHLIKQYREIITLYYKYQIILNIMSSKYIYLFSNIINIKRNERYIDQLKRIEGLENSVLSINSKNWRKSIASFKRRMRLEASWSYLGVA